MEWNVERCWLLEQGMHYVCLPEYRQGSERLPLTLNPVSRPFDWVAVDVIQFPRSRRGNQYAVVFVYYLTKWPEGVPCRGPICSYNCWFTRQRSRE